LTPQCRFRRMLCRGPELAMTIRSSSLVLAGGQITTLKYNEIQGVRQMPSNSCSVAHSGNASGFLTNSSGQAAVEFTLTFLLLLVVAWIPADFGLAFYSSQLAHNAAREGARIAAADLTLASGTTSCTLPSCTGNILKETAGRVSAALLPAATISVNLDPDTGTNCNRMVTVTVSGTYNFFFYQLLHWFGVSGNLNSTPITRQTRMRWEGQAGCS
jgi:Flp pilus assembly protein TadG